jgi:hypothetical protein
MFFPGGFGNAGMSQWGANPSAGLMAGMGEFARGKGSYVLDKARADSINVETMEKWNKALHARQRVVRQEQEKRAAQLNARRAGNVELNDLSEGRTLNNLLAQIFEADSTARKSGRASAPLSLRMIRDIPFEFDSEAISLCLDRMTTATEFPAALRVPRFDENRQALHAAVVAAREQDDKGTVSQEAVTRINEELAKFRAAYLKSSANFSPGREDALSYFVTVASLSRILFDPSMRKFLEDLSGKDDRTVGDLIAFMDSFNLRFGRATTDRQIEIYKRLVPLLTSIRDSLNSAGSTPAAADQTGDALRAAAAEVFRSMNWEDLEAHSRER